MIFCNRCICDSEAESIIERTGTIGTCPLCNSHNAKLYDTKTNSSLTGLFDNLLSVYTPQENLPEDYPIEDLRPLDETIQTDWGIFNHIPKNCINDILMELSPDTTTDLPQLFTQPVGIWEKFNLEYLREHSILHSQSWADFTEAIKHKNRFHSNLIDIDRLKEYCLHISKTIPIDSHRYYRGRIAHNRTGYRRNEMGAPPKEIAANGRANSSGISRLYLTYDQDTTLHEIRAAEFDYVTIATFKPVIPINVVDLKQIGTISPLNPDVDCTALAINRNHLQKINQEMSKTMRRGDSILDYLPTQYICDLIMSIVDDDGHPIFDGIEYQSAMKNSGANLAIFYPEKFKCTYCKTYEITGLEYHKNPL